MCRTATGAASELILMLMKDLLLRNLGRIFAMLGCTTIVTACYGTPYSIYNEDIYGRVLDAESGNPIPDISVRITDATSASSGVLVPTVEIYDGKTDSEGRFYGSIANKRGNAVIVECKDVDGKLNGSYQQKQETIENYSPQEIIIEMTPLVSK